MVKSVENTQEDMYIDLDSAYYFPPKPPNLLLTYSLPLFDNFGPVSTSHIRERKISPKFFRPKFFHGRPRGMSVTKCLFFQDFERLTEVFGRMSAGISGQKLPLWADFSSQDHIIKHAEARG